MPFPIIPAVLAVGAAGLSWLVFKPESKESAKAGGVPPFKPGVDIPGVTNKGAPKPTLKRPGGKIAPSPFPQPPRPQPGPSPIGGIQALVTARSGLNVRTSPNTSGKVLTLVPYNNRVTLPEPTTVYPATPGASAGWKKVITGSGLSGYASAEYLSMGGGAAPGPSPGPVPPGPLPAPGPSPFPPGVAYGTITAKSGLNLRKGPNANTAKLALIPFGAKVGIPDGTVLPLPPTAGAPKGWLRITSPNGITGYGSAEWIMISGGGVASKMTGEYDEEVNIDLRSYGLRDEDGGLGLSKYALTK